MARLQESPLYKLKRSLREARQIVARIPKETVETKVQELKIRSYILLTHAALEQYLEEIASNTAKIALKLYKDDGAICHALIALISSKVLDDVSEKSRKKLNSELAQNLEIFASESCSRFQNIVRNNHGIKQNNQVNLLLPIGIDPADCNSALMANLDTLGQYRGDVAHRYTIAKKVHTRADIDSLLYQITEQISSYDIAARDVVKLKMSLAS